MSQVADLDERRAAAAAGADEEQEEEGTGVVASDLADDTPIEPPDPEDSAEKEEEPKPVPPMQQKLPGTWDGIGTEFGGAPPQRSEIRLLGGKMDIEGSFAKGTELDLIVRVKVTGVLGQDTVDAWGQVEGTVRRHNARMISVRRVSDEPGAK